MLICDSAPSAQKYVLPMAVRNSDRSDQMAPRSRTVCPAGFQGIFRAGLATFSRPISRLVISPQVATPNRAEAESHQRPWPAGLVRA